MPKNNLVLGALMMSIVGVSVFFSASALVLNLANIQIARGAPTRAQTYLNEARQFPTLPRLALAQARVAFARGDMAQANAALAEDVLHADPLAEFLRADIAWQLKQADVAFAHWRNAGAFVYFSNAAHRALYRQEWQMVVEHARIASGIAPDDADAHFLLGSALASLDANDAEAWRALERASALTRDAEFLATVLSRQAEIMWTQGNLHDALALFAKARHVAPLDARPRTGYALVQLELDARARGETITLLTQVVNDSPWYLAAYVALSELAEQSGVAAQAEMWLARGRAQNPNEPGFLLALGQLYARQGRAMQAKELLTLALEREIRVEYRAAIRRTLEQLP